ANTPPQTLQFFAVTLGGAIWIPAEGHRRSPECVVSKPAASREVSNHGLANSQLQPSADRKDGKKMI
ncbi:MAG: hypothetical protein ACR2RE_13200, partial [Geminicoccaceae bacterium]